LLLAALILQRLRQQAIQVNDSEDFRGALEIWTPLVALNRNTPRTVKRFVNWIRYLAMLQQGAEEDRTVGEQVLDRLNRLWRQGASRRPHTTTSDSLAEPQLIALGALCEVFGSTWRRMLSDPGLAGDREGSRHQKLLARLPILVQQHRERFKRAWPPSPRELDVFERLLAGIRVSGETRAIGAESVSEELLAGEDTARAI
jgi:hypothetical protein